MSAAFVVPILLANIFVDFPVHRDPSTGDYWAGYWFLILLVAAVLFGWFSAPLLKRIATSQWRSVAIGESGSLLWRLTVGFATNVRAYAVTTLVAGAFGALAHMVKW
jgi:hypothetical protein